MLKKIILLSVTLFLLIPVKSQIPYQQFEWVNYNTRVVSTTTYYGKTTEVLDDGSTITVGAFGGSMDFDNGPGTFIMTAPNFSPPSYPQSPSIFILKLDSAGNFLWAKQFTRTLGYYGNFNLFVKCDHSGNIVIGGDFTGSMDVDPGVGTYILSANLQNTSPFIVKLDPQGNFISAFMFGEYTVNPLVYGFCDARDMAFDQQNNIYLTGVIRTSVDLDPGPNRVITRDTLPNGVPVMINSFLIKFDSTGNYQWHQQWISERNAVFSLDISSTNSIYISGTFQENLYDTTGTLLLSTASYKYRDNIFISKLDVYGNRVWSKIIEDKRRTNIGGGSYRSSQANCIKVDEDQFVYFAGRVSDSTDFDPDPNLSYIVAPVECDGYLAKLDSNGNFLNVSLLETSFVNNFGTRGVYVWGFDIDKQKNFYLVGGFTGTVDFDPGPNTVLGISGSSSQVESAYALKLSPTGDYQWHRTFVDSTRRLFCTNVSVSKDNKVYINGYSHITNTFNFNPPNSNGIVTSLGNRDDFLLQLSQCTDYFNTITTAACSSYTSPSGDSTWTSSGVYQDRLITSQGCDSIFTINLSIGNVDTTVLVQNHVQLKAQATGATYQWLDCNNGYAAISGATSQNFVAINNGSYAVEITDGSCVDTSSCYTILSVGLEDKPIRNTVSVFPNPNNGTFTLRFQNGVAELHLRIRNMVGQVISTQVISHTTETTLEINQAPGIYFLEIEDANGGLQVIKVIKE